MKHLTRRDFLRLAATTLGGAVLAGCGGRQLARMTETPVPAAPARPTISGAPTPTPPSLTGAPDLLLVNGKVITVDAKNTIAQAVAIKNGLIQAVGTSDELRARAGATTQIIDLKGKAVTPGLIDPHLHFRAVGLNNAYYTPFLPPDVKDVPSLQRTLADAIKGKRPGEWLMGYYMVLSDKSVPTKQDLDAVSPKNPVFIMHIGGHWGTANSVALQMAQVTSSTPSPQGGIIEKKNGEPTGVFYNHRAMDVLRQYAPPITADQIKQSILTTQTLLGFLRRDQFSRQQYPRSGRSPSLPRTFTGRQTLLAKRFVSDSGMACRSQEGGPGRADSKRGDTLQGL
jgi:hypothetical protein